MLKILGNEYITDKEASERYGFSQGWFCQQRFYKKGPPYIKYNKRKILYPIKEADVWFKKHMEMVE